MELKTLVTKYVYRIEPKPGGGFIARASDPSIPSLEAPTRAELQQKIQATIFAGLSQDFPGLKLPLQSAETKFAFHIEHNPNGGFDIHSSDPSAAPIQALTHGEVESHFAEKLLGFIGKNFAPEIAEALAAQGASGDIKVVVKKSGFTWSTHGHDAALPQSASAQSSAAALPPQATSQSPSSGAPTLDGASIKQASFGSTGPISASPITPGKDSSGFVFRVVVAALIIAAVIFLFLRHH